MILNNINKRSCVQSTAVFTMILNNINKRSCVHTYLLNLKKKSFVIHSVITNEIRRMQSKYLPVNNIRAARECLADGEVTLKARSALVFTAFVSKTTKQLSIASPICFLMRAALRTVKKSVQFFELIILFFSYQQISQAFS